MNFFVFVSCKHDITNVAHLCRLTTMFLNNVSEVHFTAFYCGWYITAEHGRCKVKVRLNFDHRNLFSSYVSYSRGWCWEIWKKWVSGCSETAAKGVEKETEQREKDTQKTWDEDGKKKVRFTEVAEERERRIFLFVAAVPLTSSQLSHVLFQ